MKMAILQNQCFSQLLLVSTLCIVLLLVTNPKVSGQSLPTIRSFLFTKRHTPAPTPPFRVCPCSSGPCHNGGTCSNVRRGSGSSALPTFTCECTDRWSGDVCHECTGANSIVCSDICFSRRNGICEDGGSGSVTPSQCTIGEDCADCSARCLP